MKNIFPALFLGAISLLISCSSDEYINPTVPEGNVMLSNLQAGQKSSYLRYTTTCDGFRVEFKFTGDTLILETIHHSEGFKLKESLTPGSPFFSGNVNLYPVYKNGSNFIIPERSSSMLFFFYGDDTIRLKPEVKVRLDQSGCRLKLGDQNFIGNEIGFVKKFSLGPIREENKTAVSCVPIIYAIDAYLIYDENYLFMSHTVSDQFQGEVNGWVLNY